MGGWVGIALTGVMVLVALGGYTIYGTTSTAASTRSTSAASSARTARRETGALNVLLVGSDTREGDNKQYGQMSHGGRAHRHDHPLHISPNRDKATLISFPRDSMVQMPACKSEAGAPVAAGTR